MAQLLSSIQPPPFRVPLLDDQGQLVETWARFFLAAQAAIVQILAAKPLALIGSIPPPLDDASGLVDDFAGISAPITGRISGGAFTQGSVIFAGSGGILSQNNANFFWNDTTLRLILSATATGAGLTVAGDALFSGSAQTFGIASAAIGGLKLFACNAGPLFGAGFGGIAYRNTGEVWADPAFVLRGNGYAFEDATAAWLMNIAPTGNVSIGIASTDTSALPLDRLHIRGGALRIDNDSTAADFVRLSYASSQATLTKQLNITGTASVLGGPGVSALNASIAKVGEVNMTVANTLAGVANIASFTIGTDLINNFVFTGYSSTYTPSGYAFANGGALANTGAGGMSFAQTGTGDIRFYTTGSQTLRMKIATGGQITTTSGAMLGVNGTARTNPLAVKASGTGFAQGFGVYDTTDDGFLEIMYNGTSFQIGATYQSVFGYKPIAFFTTQIERMRIFAGGGVGIGSTVDPGNTNLSLGGKVTTYNAVATVAGGVPAIYGNGRLTAQTGAVASVAAYTVGAADGSFLVSMNLLITAFTVGSVSGVVTYTSEDGTARSLTLNFSAITGVLATTAGAAGAFEGVPLHIRAKASTAITATTTVSAFTGTYNVEAYITQLG